MASPSPRPPQAAGSTSSRGADLEWRRGAGKTEPAPSGPNKGRGGGRSANGGGHRGGRGRTGNRGGGRAPAADSKHNDQEPKVADADAKTTVPSSSTTAQTPGTTNNSSAPEPSKEASGAARGSRTKPSAKRPSGQRKAPALAIDPPPISETPKAPTTAPLTRPTNRRKRSQQNNKSPPSAGPTQTFLLPDPKPSARGRKSVTNPPTPNPASKDVPPHISSNSDVDTRNSIDNLVERVRAMASVNRSTTPSHIDWAGDDDDSLPDLNDWGYTTKITDDETSTIDRSEGISPILEGQLKPLPDAMEIPRGSPPSHASTVAPTPIVDVTLADEDQTPMESSMAEHSSPLQTPIKEDSGKKPIRAPSNKSEDGRASRNTNGTKSGAPPSPRLLSHPSLPPKPEWAVGSSTRSRNSPSVSPARASAKLSPSVSPSAKPKSLERTPPRPVQSVQGEDLVTQTATTEGPSPGQPPIVSLPSREPFPNQEIPPAQAEKVHIPEAAAGIKSPARSLKDSIHAPKSTPSTSPPNGDPSSLTDPSAPTSRSFNPTHYRSHSHAHVTGRPRGLSRGASGANPLNASHLGTHSLHPPHSFETRHNRAFSSPPVPNTHARAPHATRPVITQDARAKLAKQLGVGTPGSASPPKPMTTTNV